MARPEPVPTLRRTWWQWGLLAVGAVGFIWVLGGVDLIASQQLIRNAGPLLLLALLPYVTQIAFDALAWRTLLLPLRWRVPWLDLFGIRLASEAVLMSLPMGGVVGETLKPYLLQRRFGVPASAAVASLGVKKALLVIGEGTYLFAGLMVGVYWVTTHSRAIWGRDGLLWFGLGVAALLFLIGGFMAVSMFGGRIAARLHRLLGAIPSRRWRALLADQHASFGATDDAMRTLRLARGANLRAYGFLLLAWMSEAFETWFILHLLGSDVPFVAAFAMESCVVVMRNFAVFVPAGLGVQDAGYVAFLHGFGFGPWAGAFVIAKRLKEAVSVGLGYGLFFWMESRGRAAQLEPA